MLIKLDSGASAEMGDFNKLEVGSIVLRYVLTSAYDKGEVITINNDEVVVDFADNVRSFDRRVIGLVYGNGHDEHWMTTDPGKLLKDFHGSPVANAQIESLEDLLDFDKWMV